MIRVELQVLLNKGRHKIVPVLVTLLVPYPRPITTLLIGRYQCVGRQLLLQPRILRPLVHKRRHLARHPAAQNFHRVIRLPRTFPSAQVVGESLDTPRTLGRMRNGSKGRTRAVPIRVPHRNHQRPVPAHGMPAYPALRCQQDRPFHHFRQLLHNVRVHFVVRLPRRRRGVQVKPGTVAKVPRPLRVGGHRRPARRCVRDDESNAELRGRSLRASFGGKVFVGAR
mmetsp:Transcript_5803/g.14184  ORF Transcript_5803/g.14184 Transcript_5803/m.14184 type:complete len:225 (+) Transcript_5803:404-1078(+)